MTNSTADDLRERAIEFDRSAPGYPMSADDLRDFAQSELDRQNAATLARLDEIINLKRLDAIARAVFEFRRELKAGNGGVS